MKLLWLHLPASLSLICSTAGLAVKPLASKRLCNSARFSTTSHLSPLAAFNATYRDPFFIQVEDVDKLQISSDDLNSLEFVSASTLDRPDDLCSLDDDVNCNIFPFAGMLRNSARYIADHSHRTAVFYVPGDFIPTKDCNKLMADIALSWMLGLKICLVVGCRLDVACPGVKFPHECHNALRVTEDDHVRALEEDAGFVRFEVERMLSRHLRLHGGTAESLGNVVGGNFYTARPFGVIEDIDYKNSGYPTKIHTERIMNAMEANDIVLLTTVGTSRMGDLVNVNGQHLAATVAAALRARKLVYMSQGDAVLRKQGASKTLQEVPLGLGKALLDHYHIKVNKAGFASFSKAQSALEPDAVELLLHLGWSAWALNQGVTRAHIVNPGDGSLLEELFSSKLGINTCLYHEDEADDLDIDDDNIF